MNKMGERLMDAMQDALAHSQGRIALKTSKINVSPVCDEISPTEIIQTRENLGMSQGVFAVVVGVSLQTVESWESGIHVPDGSARRLIMILQQDPDFPKKYGILQSVR